MNFLRLKTFNVDFYPSHIVNWKEVLDRFRTPFWMEEKKWYFIATTQGLCSLSYHLLQYSYVYNDYNSVYDHTDPNSDGLIYSSSIVCLDVDRLNDQTVVTKSKSSERFLNCREIDLFGKFNQLSISSLISFLESRVDLSHITKFHCLIRDTMMIQFLLKLKERMPCLSDLSLVFTSYTKDIEQLPQFDRIQRIDYYSELSTTSTKDFIRVFPHVKHLTVRVQSRRQIFRLINDLIHLQRAQFNHNLKFNHITRDKLIKRTRLRNHSFTSNHYIHGPLVLWINHSPSSALVKKSLTNHNEFNPIRSFFELFILVLFQLFLIVCASYFL